MHLTQIRQKMHQPEKSTKAHGVVRAMIMFVLREAHWGEFFSWIAGPCHRPHFSQCDCLEISTFSDATAHLSEGTTACTSLTAGSGKMATWFATEFMDLNLILGVQCPNWGPEFRTWIQDLNLRNWKPLLWSVFFRFACACFAPTNYLSNLPVKFCGFGLW